LIKRWSLRVDIAVTMHVIGAQCVDSDQDNVWLRRFGTRGLLREGRYR
jgi:hypothetical protein